MLLTLSHYCRVLLDAVPLFVVNAILWSTTCARVIDDEEQTVCFSMLRPVTCS